MPRWLRQMFERSRVAAPTDARAKPTRPESGTDKRRRGLDHAAFETPDPDATAAFYERIFRARIVKTEGHPVMAYVGNTGFAFHETGGPGDHVAVRVSADERDELKRRLDDAGIEWEERDHGIAKGVFFRDPDGRQLEAITYESGDDPRRP
jgi:catechol 2,3-dioxygenase-like lactoylglutathione lyase family enzyme